VRRSELRDRRVLQRDALGAVGAEVDLHDGVRLDVHDGAEPVGVVRDAVPDLQARDVLLDRDAAEPARRARLALRGERVGLAARRRRPAPRALRRPAGAAAAGAVPTRSSTGPTARAVPARTVPAAPAPAAT